MVINTAHQNARTTKNLRFKSRSDGMRLFFFFASFCFLVLLFFNFFLLFLIFVVVVVVVFCDYFVGNKSLHW